MSTSPSETVSQPFLIVEVTEGSASVEAALEIVLSR